MIRDKKSKVGFNAVFHVKNLIDEVVVAVTLEGTIIHKSGLITGGRSTHGSGKKWEDKDIQGTQISSHFQLVMI
jgi:chromosome segregation ATPase